VNLYEYAMDKMFPEFCKGMFIRVTNIFLVTAMHV